MRVVAGHAVKPIVALGVASAPRQGRPLKPDRRGIIRLNGFAPGAMTLGTDLHHGAAGSQAGASNGDIGKLGGDGEQVISTWPMAFFTTNCMVGCRRPRVSDRGL